MELFLPIAHMDINIVQVLLYARLATQDNDFVTARKHFQDVLARDEFNSNALMGLAALAMNDKNGDEAEKYWQQAREHNSEIGRAHV